MKKLLIIPVLCLLLSGCGAQETFETVSDVYATPADAQMYRVELSLPENAVVQTMEATDGSTLYLCDGYSVTVQTMEAGDLDRTLRQVTGFGKDSLTVMETVKDGFDYYECVWCASGENTDQVCRAAILDDGTYHYAVTVMADYELAGDLSATWEHILDSMTLSTG